MGSGYRDFTVGQILTADQVDGYLMRQSVMVFLSDALRDAALVGALEEGMHAYITDVPNRLTFYDGATWRVVWSDWTTWNPTYTNIVVGNGTVIAQYAYVGPNTMVASYQLTFGSTTSIGAGAAMTLPSSPGSIADVDGTQVLMYDSSGPFRRYGVLAFSSGTTVSIFSLATDSTYLGAAALDANTPFTWATGDVLAFSLVFRV